MRPVNEKLYALTGNIIYAYADDTAEADARPTQEEAATRSATGQALLVGGMATCAAGLHQEASDVRGVRQAG